MKTEIKESIADAFKQMHDLARVHSVEHSKNFLFPIRITPPVHAQPQTMNLLISITP